MEEQLRSLHARNVDLEQTYKIESRNKTNIEDINKELQQENYNMLQNNKDLSARIISIDKERMRIESEAKDNSVKLHEISEKV